MEDVNTDAIEVNEEKTEEQTDPRIQQWRSKGWIVRRVACNHCCVANYVPTHKNVSQMFTDINFYCQECAEELKVYELEFTSEECKDWPHKDWNKEGGETRRIKAICVVCDKDDITMCVPSDDQSRLIRPVVCTQCLVAFGKGEKMDEKTPLVQTVLVDMDDTLRDCETCLSLYFDKWWRIAQKGYVKKCDFCLASSVLL